MQVLPTWGLARCKTATKTLPPLGAPNEYRSCHVAPAAEEWLPATSDGRRAEVAYARALVAFVEGAPDGVRDGARAGLPQTAEQRVRYATLRAWVYGLHEQFEKQAHICFTRFHLRSTDDVDSGLQANVAGTLAPLVRELELGELGDRAETLLESVVWPQDTLQCLAFIRNAQSRGAKLCTAAGFQPCISWMAPCHSLRMLHGADCLCRSLAHKQRRRRIGLGRIVPRECV